MGLKVLRVWGSAQQKVQQSKARGLFKTAELELTEEVLRGADMDASKGRDGWWRPKLVI